MLSIVGEQATAVHVDVDVAAPAAIDHRDVRAGFPPDPVAPSPTRVPTLLAMLLAAVALFVAGVLLAVASHAPGATLAAAALSLGAFAGLLRSAIRRPGGSRTAM